MNQLNTEFNKLKMFSDNLIELNSFIWKNSFIVIILSPKK